MADYNFYVNQYKGNLIPQDALEAALAQAQRALDRMKRIYRVRPAVEDGEDLALCAMADALYAAGSRNPCVSAAAVGSVSVRYEDAAGTRKALTQTLYDCAQRYLDVYRGVGTCC